MSIVKIKPYGKFDESHVEIIKSNLRVETFPQFYTNQEFKSLKFKGTHLVESSAISRSGYGSSQSSRYSGLNPRYADLKSAILETGWQLYQRPISLRLTNDNLYTFLDGRTKDKILEEVKYKNRIVNIYEMNDFDARLFADRCNAGEDSAPAGLIIQEDLVGDLLRAIDAGELENDPDEILCAINLACGQGKFSSKKRDEIRWQVYHRQLNIQNTKLLPRSWANSGEVNLWLKDHNYINNSKVVYLPYSSTSAPKAIIAAAIKAQQNPGKEVRVVVFIRNFVGINLEKYYVTQMLKFKNEWYRYLNEISSAFFDNKIFLENRVQLYGYIPSNIESVCDDMNRMIIIGKNDQIIDASYTNIALNSSLGIDSFEQDSEIDEEDEETV